MDLILEKITYQKLIFVLDGFDPTKIIDDIRQLYKAREGWLAPFPWCEEFHFYLGDIYTRLKVIYRKKTRGTATDRVVTMSEILNPHEECEKPRTVLIEGKPGMGKTTYCKKLVFDWATGKQETEHCFPNFQIVLLIKCRDVKSDLWEAIDDQLLPRDVDKDTREKFFDFIRQNQSDVLLVLDGLDEVPEEKLPMFTEIIQGRVLPNCRVVATARYEAGMKVRKYCDTLLKVEGFTEVDAEIFIFKYFKTSEHLAQKLIFQLGNDKNLKDMTANPLNTALLCLVCEEFEGVFPESRTMLYMEIIQCVLRRYRAKKELPENGDDLIKLYENQLKHLGSIALKGLLEDNLDFDEKEFGKHAASDLPGFGFLSVQPGGSKLRPTRRYGFLHKSFQESFAGFYLCCQLISKEISTDSIAADRRYYHQLKEVLPFTCGMLAERCEETAMALIRSIATQLNQEVNEYIDVPYYLSVVLECINECKNDISNFKVKLAHAFGTFLQIPTVFLKSKKINHFIPVILASVLKANTTVKNLDLSLNNIGAAGAAGLGEALKFNRSLTELDLSYNKIGDSGAVGLCEGLQFNTSLKKLYLVWNNIGDAGAAGLGKGLQFNTSLTKLDLSHNNIGDAGAAGLVEALKFNESLTKLCLSNNNIGAVGAAGLGEGLKGNTSVHVTMLNLSNNNIGAAGAACLGEALKFNTSVTKLYLLCNNIGAAGVAGLGKGLQFNTSVTKLDLSYNNIGDAGAAALCKALKFNTCLSELSLCKNNICDVGTAFLGEALKFNKSLAELYMYDNNIGDIGAAGLGKALKFNTSLTKLVLSRNNIGDAGAAGLGEGLKCNISLTGLKLSYNKIGDTGAAGLGEGLKCSTSLTGLKLPHNNIGDAGAAGLGEGLKFNISLTGLKLSHNTIGDTGAAGLGEGLKFNISLTGLKLSHNNIGDTGAAGLAKSLKFNTSLTGLYLSHNNIGTAGAAGLGEALKFNTSLTVLSLSHNHIRTAGAAGLGEALKGNTSLSVLNLSYNYIGDAGAASLGKALNFNTSLTLLYLSANNNYSAFLLEALKSKTSLGKLRLSDINISETVKSELSLEHGNRVHFFQ